MVDVSVEPWMVGTVASLVTGIGFVSTILATLSLSLLFSSPFCRRLKK